MIAGKMNLELLVLVINLLIMTNVDCNEETQLSENASPPMNSTESFGSDNATDALSDSMGAEASSSSSPAPSETEISGSTIGYANAIYTSTADSLPPPQSGYNSVPLPSPPEPGMPPSVQPVYSVRAKIQLLSSSPPSIQPDSGYQSVTAHQTDSQLLSGPTSPTASEVDPATNPTEPLSTDKSKPPTVTLTETALSTIQQDLTQTKLAHTTQETTKSFIGEMTTSVTGNPMTSESLQPEAATETTELLVSKDLTSAAHQVSTNSPINDHPTATGNSVENTMMSIETQSPSETGISDGQNSASSTQDPEISSAPEEDKASMTTETDSSSEPLISNEYENSTVVVVSGNFSTELHEIDNSTQTELNETVETMTEEYNSTSVPSGDLFSHSLNSRNVIEVTHPSDVYQQPPEPESSTIAASSTGRSYLVETELKPDPTEIQYSSSNKECSVRENADGLNKREADNTVTLYLTRSEQWGISAKGKLCATIHRILASGIKGNPEVVFLRKDLDEDKDATSFFVLDQDNGQIIPAETVVQAIRLQSALLETNLSATLDHVVTPHDESRRALNDPVLLTTITVVVITVSLVALGSIIVLVSWHRYRRRFYGEWVVNNKASALENQMDTFCFDNRSFHGERAFRFPKMGRYRGFQNESYYLRSPRKNTPHPNHVAYPQTAFLTENSGWVVPPELMEGVERPVDAGRS